MLACITAALNQSEVRFGRASSLAPGRTFEINAAPLPSGGALVVLHDVTSIEAAEKSRRDFIANVSHELRTPLTSIQGYVETLVEDPHPKPETTREFLGVILKNASRMNRLTEDLLALASVESPELQADTAAHACLRPRGGRHRVAGRHGGGFQVALESAGAPDTPIMADPDAMNQVFGNLIENALKYGKSGKRIRVGAQQLESEVEFVVQDFGPGIAFEHLERIFERFYRVDKARSREAGGTGLGLAIVKHIVQAHGGRIWAESELGAGTAFHFTLPLAPANLTEGERRASACGYNRRIYDAGSLLNSNDVNIGRRQSRMAETLQGDMCEKVCGCRWVAGFDHERRAGAEVDRSGCDFPLSDLFQMV